MLPGVTRRGRVFYWQREHELLGGRVYKSLGTADLATANAYAGSLQKLMDRGDWDAIRRWAQDKLHVSAIERAVREGDWQSIRRLHMSGPLLGEQADLFLEKVEATRSAGTEQLRRSAVGRARAHFGADYPMHTLTQKDAEAFLHAERGGRRWSANTQASYAMALSLLWAFAMRNEREEAEQYGAEPWIRSNPWKTADRPRPQQTRFTFFTPAQALQVLQHQKTAGTPAEAFLATAFYAGLRRGELQHLRTGVDVDFRRRGVHVQSRGGDRPWKPKTANGERFVPMTPTLERALQAHVDLGFAGERYFFRPAWADAPPGEHVVRQLTIDAYQAAGFKYGMTAAGLTLHSARHSFATWLLEHGVPVPLVARLMGDTVQVLLKTYAHVIPDREQIAVAVLEDLAHGRPGVVAFRGAAS